MVYFTCTISSGIIDRTSAQTMLYLTCTMLSSVDIAHYGVPREKDWVSVDCGTSDRRAWFVLLYGEIIPEL